MPTAPRFLVGIDLGTTNTVVAYADLTGDLKTVRPRIFEIEQLVAAGEVAKRPQLPSFRYHPLDGEIAQQDLKLSWRPSPVADELDDVVIGHWARELGAKVDGRLVYSAKSWLSHAQVDRSAPILPWAGAEAVAKVSPLTASASYLNHVRLAWNHQHPEHPLEAQEVVVTVPASFDEAARALTVEAAQLASLPNILLLEEPQAVCYNWYTQHRDQAVELLEQVKLLLVCDVGGGTTDLSLIQVKVDNGQLCLDRIGVGDHLMLGGDNVDHALAHIAEKRIVQDGKALNAASLSQLVQQTRNAKELLLSDSSRQIARVTVLGGGARLIGGARSCELTRDEVLAVALDGFFPKTALTEATQKRRNAIVEFGLPYAADPAVSRHIAEFLRRHHAACARALGMQDHESTPALPDAVLFNGGVFNSPVLSQQALQVLQYWRGDQPVRQLGNVHPDLAVAYGAVGYGLARKGAQLKIGGGSARSYFLQLDSNNGARQGVCLLPQGAEEGVEIALTGHRFQLRLGQPVQFKLVSSVDAPLAQPGDICEIEDDHFVTLPPLVAALESTSDAGQSMQVGLSTALTEVGTLRLECVSTLRDDQRWKLEFELRKNLDRPDTTTTTDSLPETFARARDDILKVYGPGKKDPDPKAIKSLRNNLEKVLGNRIDWDSNLLRALFDIFLRQKSKRRRSAQHERLWFNLAGFALRPGTGFPLDEWRMEQVWPVYEQGLQFARETQSWSAWWTFWRRAAGGLNTQQQQRIFQDIAPYINPASARKLTKPTDKVKDYQEMVRLAAVLENLPVETKQQIAGWLLKRLQKSSETPISWWALGRIASRVPFYGSAHNVIAKQAVQPWLAKLTQSDWRKNQAQAFAVVMIARRSGDRSRDLDEDYRHRIIEKLKGSRVPKSWIDMVSEVKELDAAEAKRVFGEALPSGLKLIANS